jgi:hypothetical protein
VVGFDDVVQMLDLPVLCVLAWTIASAATCSCAGLTRRLAVPSVIETSDAPASSISLSVIDEPVAPASEVLVDVV